MSLQRKRLTRHTFDDLAIPARARRCISPAPSSSRPKLLARVSLLFLVLVPLGALIARDSRAWLVLLIGIPLILRIILWIVSPYSSAAREAIDPSQETLRTIEQRTEGLTRVPILGFFFRLARNPDADEVRKTDPPPRGEE